ncbi:acetylornithine carbamoyltransferase [Lewinellaceae bacterium SD302]|nr:acetylornithine carbamoyltransferase [Lewinellaceae bacterium SD302]
MHNLLSTDDVDAFPEFLKTAAAFKKNPYTEETLGRRKTLVLLFFNPSLRTRVSTQKAAYNLGMNVILLNVSQAWGIEFEDGTVMNLDTAEHVREAAAVISQYADLIGIRTFPGLKDRALDYQDRVLQQFARYTTVPIVNMESATVHPLQGLTDVFTIEAHKRIARPKVVLSWAPHPRALPQAVANSFLAAAGRMDYELVLTHPPGYALSEQFSRYATIEHDQQKAFAGADFIYAKNWSSYESYGEILSTDPKWMITAEKMQSTNKAKFMHCLPVRRNVVVEDAVLDSPASLVIEQAANRTVIAQTVLSKLLKSPTGCNN